MENGILAKKMACLKLDPTLLQPTACVSNVGISSSTLFTGHAIDQSTPTRTGSISTRDMLAAFQVFNGPDSLNGAALAHQRQQNGPDQRRQHARQEGASEADTSNDANDQDRAASGSSSRRNTTDSAGTTTRGVAASGEPAASAARFKPISNTAASMSLLLARSEAAAAAEKLEESIRQHGAQLVGLKHVAPRIARKYGITHNPSRPRPTSAAAALPRRASNHPHSSTGSSPSMAAAGSAAAAGGGVGGGGAGLQAGAAGPAAEAAGDATNASSKAHAKRPGSAAFCTTTRAMAQQTGSKFVNVCADSPGPGKYDPRYACVQKATRGQAMQKLTSARKRGEAAEGSSNDASTAAAPAAGSRPASAPAQRLMQQSASSSIARRVSRAGNADPAADPGSATQPDQQQQRQQQLQQQLAGQGGVFEGAHRVHAHQRQAYVPASPAFLATARQSIVHHTTAGHLFLAYFQEGYDYLTRKSSRPALGFAHQTSRLPVGTGADTPAALGPGAYCHAALPPTSTGRHVTAGHSRLAQTRDWTRAPARPGSAPPAAAAAQPGPSRGSPRSGYYGPTGPAASLWPDEPQYSDMVSIRTLQERTRGSPKLRAAGHGPAHGASSADSAPGTGQSGCWAADGSGGAPAVYLDPEALQRFSSTGLSKRVPGGSFSTTTRELTARTIRAMADGKVIPPAAVAVMTATDLTYDPNYSAQAHHGRTPVWQLPPNRTALSQRWITTAATAYM